ncbi:MAG TPA: HAD family hydrolase [Dehalococcoidia bacterium]|nr:HAD family hydrolase [Dehalococcoidia bacterium]
MSPIRHVFLDDGGVINDNRLRAPQWRPLVGAFFVPRLGGTVEAWADANTRTYQQVFQRQQARLAVWQPGRSYLDELRLTDIDWLESMCRDLGIETPPEDECAALAREAQNWIMSQVVAGVPGVADIVRLLSTQYALYTASGGASYELELYMQTLGLEGVFLRLYGADLVNMPKLSAEYYRRVFQDAGVDPSMSVVVDDHAETLAWAREVGAFTVLISLDGSQAEVDLVLPRLAELPEALHKRFN